MKIYSILMQIGQKIRFFFMFTIIFLSLYVSTLHVLPINFSIFFIGVLSISLLLNLIGIVAYFAFPEKDLRLTPIYARY